MKKPMNWIKAMAAIAAIALIYTLSFASSDSQSTLYVNGKEVDVKTHGGPFVSGKQVYLPIAAVVNGMGDKATLNSTKTTATIKQNNGTEVNVRVNTSNALIGDKNTPVHTKTFNGIIAPSGFKMINAGGHPALPAESFKQLLGYDVKVDKTGTGVYTVTVGKKPVVEIPPETPEEPPVDEDEPVVGEDPRYPYPSGWTAPVLKSKLTADYAENTRILGAELGYDNYGDQSDGTATAAYKSDGYTSDIQIETSKELEAVIHFNVWMGTEYTPDGHKVPYVAKETFRFFLGDKDGLSVYDILDKGYNGNQDVLKHFNKKFILQEREIELVDTGHSVIVFIGKKGKSYDDNWEVK